MQTITTDLFTLRIPDNFNKLTTERVFFQADDTLSPSVNQGAMLAVTVYKIKDLDTDVYSGNTLQEKFEDACLSLSYKSEKLGDEKTNFNGMDAFILHAHTDAPWQDTHFKIRYFYAGVVLDEKYILEFRAMHEKLPSEELASWVMAAYESLEIKGDLALRNQAWKLHVLEMQEEERNYQQALNTDAADAEERKKNDFCTVNIPENGEERCAIGAFEFEVLREESSVKIAKFSRELLVTLKAKTSQKEQATKAGLLDEYADNGCITFTIPAKGIHVDGVPKGMLYFEEEKTNAPLFLNARSEGFDYRLAFNGSITFDSGWVLLKGEMTKSYHKKAFPIQLAQKFDMQGLDWKEYRFTSLAETETANPEHVQYVALQNPHFLKLPDSIFTFTGLKELSISQRSNNWENEKLPFRELQPEIGQLTEMRQLHMSGASIKRLPEGVGNLKQLEHLSVSNCELETVPDAIFQLPQLKYCWLSSNRLTKISEHLDLPELQCISLDRNLLKTVPEILAKQPKLRKIDLGDNPLEHLPEAFNDVKEIELAMEDKLRLLDFSYQGADGSGLVSWNDAGYWSENDTDLIPELTTVIAANTLQEQQQALMSFVKKAIGFNHIGEEDYTEIGNHRFGGMPDLPEAIPYPRFGENWREDNQDYVFEFIGQINCSAIAPLQEYLPRKGMLFFFLETIHNVYGGDASPCKVVYVENVADLVSGKRFEFSEDDYSEMIGSGYQGNKVSAKKMNSVPSLYASYVNTHLFLGAAESLKDNEDLIEEIYNGFEAPVNAKNKFEYAVNAYGFSQHEHPELQASLKKKGKPEDWMILLTVTSAGDMQWGDAGDLFFVIHKSDLAKGDFSNVFVTLESS